MRGSRGASRRGRLADPPPDRDRIVTRAMADLDLPPTAGLLLVGSRADFGPPVDFDAPADSGAPAGASNVNLLLVTAPDTRCDLAQLAAKGVTVRPMTLLDNHIYPIDGTEVSIDAVPEPSLLRLERVFAPVESVLAAGPDELDLPVLDLLELRLLARLAAGRVLCGPETVELWRRRLRTDLLPTYYVISTYAVARHYTRKAATAHRSGDRLSMLLLSQVAAEHYLYCAFAIRDIVLHETKQLGRWVHLACQSGDRVPLAVREIETFLAVTGDRPGERLSLLERWRADLLATLRDADRFRTVRPLLEPEGDDPA